MLAVLETDQGPHLAVSLHDDAAALAAVATVRATFVYEFLPMEVHRTVASVSGSKVQFHIVDEIGVGHGLKAFSRFLSSDYLADAVEYFFDGLLSRYLAIVSLILVVVNERLGLGVIGVYPVLDGCRIGIILPSLYLGSLGNPLKNSLVLNCQREDLVHLFSPFGEHLVQLFSLGYGAWETVQKETVYVLVLGECVADHSYDHLVRNKIAALYKLLCLKSERGSGSHFLPQKVSR